jgi:glycerophosphoryl diester phosphodiesterase
MAETVARVASAAWVETAESGETVATAATRETVGTAATAATAGAATAVSARSSRTCRVYGHGSAEPANEINTLPSFARVRDTGADGVELDVRRTADDCMAVIHDHLSPDGRAVAET